jgi:hypothetical protein
LATYDFNADPLGIFTARNSMNIPNPAFSTATFTGYYQAPVGVASGTFTWPPALSNNTVVKQEPLPTEKREMPAVGYRAWRLQGKFRLGLGKQQMLCSTASMNAWQSGVNIAACSMATVHEAAPDQFCGCGFYILHDMDQLDSHVQLDDYSIVGAVVGWGKVIQHGAEGWRTQYARILGLLDCKYSDTQLKNTRIAAKAYGVEVYSRENLERWVKEWGDPL